MWLAGKTEGTYGEIRPGTAASYRCYVELHLLPGFGECFVEEIDRARCLRFKARLLSDARELRAAIEAQENHDEQSLGVAA